MTQFLLYAALALVAAQTTPVPSAPKTLQPEPIVLEVFADGQLLLNIGSSHGAKPGEQLSVFRLGPQPKYVGKLEIKSVGGMHALARMSGRFKEAHAGDSVSLRLEGDGDSRKKDRVRGDLIWEKP